MEGLDFTNTMPSPGAPNYADLDLGMTFGIELECIAVYPTGLMAPPGQPGDAITAISLGMKAMGINSTGHETLEDDVPIWGEGEEYSQWIVQAEGGLELSEAELRNLKRFANGVEYDVQPLEMSSRILDFRGNWIEEIRKVLSVLTALRTQGCSFVINSTTGFHVHIGFGRQRIPLRTAKAVLQFCTGFEDRLDSIYSIDRINEKCAENVQPGQHFNAGLAWHFQHNPRTDFGPNVFHWLTEIEEAPSFEALGKFFCNDLPGDTNCYKDRTDAHFSTLNLENLYQSPLGDWDSTTSPSGTIEFRQHQGVLHFDAIYMQILLTRAIVTFCHSAPEVDFLQLFAKICDPSFGLIDLLRSIGCPQILIQYYQDRRGDSELNDAMAEYLETVVELEAGEFQGSDALDAQTFIETFERSNWPAVLSKIEAKRAAGAYGEHDTRYMVVWLEFAKFYIDRCQYFSGVEANNMTRGMIFQQLNGDDIWTDPTDEEMSGFTLE